MKMFKNEKLRARGRWVEKFSSYPVVHTQVGYHMVLYLRTPRVRLCGRRPRLDCPRSPYCPNVDISSRSIARPRTSPAVQVQKSTGPLQAHRQEFCTVGQVPPKLRRVLPNIIDFL
jgi:hypothetical protein